MMLRFLLIAFAAGCATSEPIATEDIANKATTVIPACSAGTWCMEPPPVPTGTAPFLHGVWAVNADNVFAVGENGTILQRTNSAWTVMPNGLPSGTTTNLLGVWAASDSDAWAVGGTSGGTGTVLHYNGTAWSVFATSTTSEYAAVWGSSSTDVWITHGSEVLHWNGTALSLSASLTGSLIAISGTGPADVWVTGENTFLYHFTSGTWVKLNPQPVTTLMFSVLDLSPTDVWVTDLVSRKETMHFSGSAWTGRSTGAVTFNSLSARASNDVWGVGASLHVGHWDGSSWNTTQPLPTAASGSLFSVTTTVGTPGHMWVVGDGATIGHMAF